MKICSFVFIHRLLRLTIFLGPLMVWFCKTVSQELHKCLYHFLEKKPRKDHLSRDWRDRRNAIRLTNEHTVETLVVADADMVQYHGAEAAQRFILTVMNMVSPQEGPAVGGLRCLQEGGRCGTRISCGKEVTGLGSQPVVPRAGAMNRRKIDSGFYLLL